jgi:hypothetical protein
MTTMRRPIVIAAALLLATSFAVAQRASAPSADHMVLGQLATGASVTFARSSAGEWGLEISGTKVPRIVQPKPAQVELYRSDTDVRQLAAGYKAVQKSAGAVVARATLAGEGGTTFAVEDRWTVSGAVLSLARRVTVGGSDEFSRGSFGGGPPAPGTASAPTSVVRRRYHPVKAGFTQGYEVRFRFGKSESFRDMERDAWRWAWQVLAPKATPVDVEIVRRTLADHLAVRVVPMNPPAGEGFDIRTGKASGVRGEPSLSQRSVSEDTRIAVDMYRREKARGRQHPEWLAWARDYASFLVSQQRADGSLPANWAGGTGAVKGESGATSYAAVPVLVRIAEETGDRRYADAAVKVGNYVWTNFGSKNVYLGATGGDIADKESGMLSLEAFLALYEHTKDATWLERARSAASYTESWIWIWNVPMPIGANPADLGWKPGVPTIGVNSIGSNVAGHVDQYLDWAVPSFARMYRYTRDPHYLDVARILLHGTKAMLALPGRSYDLLGPGWQQEHWRMGPGVRGVGAHRTWLPWISVNHLHGITGLEDFDKALYRQLAEGKYPSRRKKPAAESSGVLRCSVCTCS